MKTKDESVQKYKHKYKYGFIKYAKYRLLNENNRLECRHPNQIERNWKEDL